jgi:hypothetical protein
MGVESIKGIQYSRDREIRNGLYWTTQKWKKNSTQWFGKPNKFNSLNS